MDQAHDKIVSFIWGIADDGLRDLFRRGKYPDMILPMCMLRRIDDAHITEQRAALADAAGQAFFNTSRFTLRDLKSRGSQSLRTLAQISADILAMEKVAERLLDGLLLEGTMA